MMAALYSSVGCMCGASSVGFLLWPRLRPVSVSCQPLSLSSLSIHISLSGFFGRRSNHRTFPSILLEMRFVPFTCSYVDFLVVD